LIAREILQAKAVSFLGHSVQHRLWYFDAPGWPLPSNA